MAEARRAEKEKLAAAIPPAPAPEPLDDGGPRIGELKNDDRFRAMIATELQKDESLVGFYTRLATDSPTAEDETLKIKWRAEYMRRAKEVELLNSGIAGRMQALRTMSPDLNAVCNAHGEDIFTKALAGGFNETAFRDYDSFKTHVRQFAALGAQDQVLAERERSAEQFQDSEAAHNKLIAGFCEKYQVSDEVFDAIGNEPNFTKRAARYQEVIRSQMKFFERWNDKGKGWLKGKSSLDEARDIARTSKQVTERIAADESVIEALKGRRDELLKNCGGLLRALSTDNEEIRLALARASSGEKLLYPGGVEATPPLADIKEIISDEQIYGSESRNEFARYREESDDENIREHFFDLPTREKNKVIKEYWDRRTEARVRRQKGLLARLVEWCLKEKLKKVQETLRVKVS